MSQLTFEEFRKLPRDIQNVRLCELSDHDRFLARMNDWGPGDLKRETSVPQLSPQEEWDRMPPDFKEFFKEFKPPG